MRLISHAGLLVLLLMSSLSFALGTPPRGEGLDFDRTLRVGVLASLTGSWSSLGRNTVAALEIAAAQIEAADAPPRPPTPRATLCLRHAT